MEQICKKVIKENDIPDVRECLNEEKFSYESFLNPDISTFWDVSRFPKNRDGSECYVSILGFWKDFWRPKYYDPATQEQKPGNKIFRRYFPATEEGMQGIRDLIESNKFEALYRSQAFFPKIRKTQRKEDISAISHAWLDLDINKLGERRKLIRGDRAKGIFDRWVDNDHYRPELFQEWQSLDDAGKAEWLISHCVNNEIPEPTEVVLSGGGAYLLWQFTDTVFIRRRRRKAGQKNPPRSYIDVIEDIHRNLRNRLDYLMADITPCSAQTVLRIPGSINYKYSPLGHSCRSVWFNADNRYSSDDFKQRVLGIAPYAGTERYQQAKEIDAIRAKARKQGEKTYRDNALKWSQKAFLKADSPDRGNIVQFPVKASKNSPYKQSRRIIGDLKELAKLRWGGSVMEGYRDMFCHIAVSMASAHFQNNPNELLPYVKAQMEDIIPSDYLAQHFESDNITSLNKLMTACDVSDVKPGFCSWRYAYSIDRIIEKLAINEDEMKYLDCLVSKTIKKERRKQADKVYQAKKRRNAGSVRREHYEGEALSKTKPWEKLGICRRTWERRQKKSQRASVDSDVKSSESNLLSNVG